jgi:hypothetical protein
MKFINRKAELKALENKWQENKPQLFIVYGKRRVGKTELIKQFIKNKPAIYFLADRRTVFEQFKELGRIIGEYFKDDILIKNGFSDWLEVFSYLKNKTTDKFIFAVDEYPYLVESDGATSSLFQKGWDEYLKDSRVFIILSGSSIAMMESETLIHKSPLYGRRTGQSLVKPLKFKESWEFFPKKNFDDFLSIYTITGGMPAYLMQFDADLSLEKNIALKIFNKTSFLHNEVEFTLKDELREPKNYLSILKAIAWGKRKFGEISSYTGMQKNILNKYFSTLTNLQLVDKEYPSTEDKPDKSRKGLYRIADNFFIFWFQYIFQYRSYLEIENYDFIFKKMFGGLNKNNSSNSSFKILEALAYEKVCQEILGGFEKKIFSFERIGRWWENEKEIDIAGINNETKEIIFGECKWSEKPIGTNIYEDLLKKAADVQWNRGKRKEYFILFSKSGFTEGMVERARKDKVFLVYKNELKQ